MDRSTIRISKEVSDLQKTSDLSLAVACQDSDVRFVRALVMGPHETPYEFGFFEFNVKFGKEYPSKSPSVVAVTTDSGRCRFNPNIYANGKVCLSILGTWRGEPGEEWSSAQGLESILLSIQSLMSQNPYENEPGFETARSSSDKALQKDYCLKIRHESLRISVIQRMECYLGINPGEGLLKHGKDDGSEKEPWSVEDEEDDAVQLWDPFIDLCKRRFLWYYESYMAAASDGMESVKDKTSFAIMPFETSGNIMNGVFNFTSLGVRLGHIKAALDSELGIWRTVGLEAQKLESTVAVNLMHQFEQVKSAMKRGEVPHDVALDGGNPFVWIISYFGRPMTNLDGGIIRIKVHFSPSYPIEQPRTISENKLFHHHIASDGTVCYNLKLVKSQDAQSHVYAVIAVLEEDDPAYDPREIVNPEATKMYWSPDPDSKRKYNRRLRRSVQDSMEELAE